jgi:hypothetical protein
VNGYEVVNDPAETTFQLASESQTGASAIASVSSAQPVATPLEETAIVSAPIPVETTQAAADAPLATASPIVPSSSTVPVGLKVALARKQGQSAEQQARDRYECYRFAVVQSGFDPMRGSNAASQSDYDRAQAACFDGRGYSVR